MMVIGLTGGIAMGKSEAAKMLRELGYPIFDSDAEVHKLYDSPAGADLIGPFLPDAVTNGVVDRAILSAHVLKDAGLLKQLEGLVHGEIRKRRQAFLAQARGQGAKAAILDIPLLFETGAEQDVDKTITVSARPEIQRQRALARPGMTQDRLNLILARQMPDPEKRCRAAAILENNGTIAEMRAALLAILKDWGLQ